METSINRTNSSLQQNLSTRDLEHSQKIKLNTLVIPSLISEEAGTDESFVNEYFNKINRIENRKQETAHYPLNRTYSNENLNSAFNNEINYKAEQLTDQEELINAIINRDIDYNYQNGITIIF